MYFRCVIFYQKKGNVKLLIPFVEKKLIKKNKKKVMVLNTILKLFLYLMLIKK